MNRVDAQARQRAWRALLKLKPEVQPLSDAHNRANPTNAAPYGEERRNSGLSEKIIEGNRRAKVEIGKIRDWKQ